MRHRCVDRATAHELVIQRTSRAPRRARSRDFCSGLRNPRRLGVSSLTPRHESSNLLGIYSVNRSGSRRVGDGTTTT